MQAQTPIRIGYIRVSSTDQNIDRQLDGEDLTVTFVDKASGKNTDRTQLQALLTGNWPHGSTVVVHSMDRLARSLSDLLAIVEDLTSRGIAANRMRTISYGKERPVAVCNDISCWSQNRRAQTVLNSRADARS